MLGIHDTDNEWRKWPESNLFYAVLTDPINRVKQDRKIFFQSGETHFQRLIIKFDELGFTIPRKGHALDYGCGVGRVLRPMSEFFNQTTGIDVAPRMLCEAKKHLPATCVTLRHFDGKNIDECLRAKRGFQFIHSAMVFQHIRPGRGMKILEKLVQRLDHDGRAFIQLPVYAIKKLAYYVNQIVTCHPMLLKLSRKILKKKHSQNDPVMQMNVYALERLIRMFYLHEIDVINVDLKKDTKNELIIGEFYLVRG